ncbi:MAG: SDR family NAD(P)-dependent oxidoreductase [Geminicoccaceae bacterium]
MSGLIGRHALVTGAGSGIGAAIARSLAAAGTRLTLVGRRSEPLKTVSDETGGATVLTADLTREAEVQAMAAELREPVQILIVNAGAAESCSFSKIALEQWRKMIDANLTSAFLTSRALLPAMVEEPSARIVFVASTAGLRGYPYVAAYAAAKHGLIGLMRCLALETAGTGVTVNAVCPGFTETPLLERSVDQIVAKTGRSREDAVRQLTRTNPQGRLVRPEEVADSVLWLCGQGASAVTGQAISISGGEVQTG